MHILLTIKVKREEVLKYTSLAYLTLQVLL
jgi:hypothetical protein